MCDLYAALGVDLGELALVSDAPEQAAGRDRAVPAVGAQGPLVAAARPIPSPPLPRAGCACAPAPGRRGVELPLVISDHCDWPELVADHRRDRRRGGVGDARARGRAGASDRPDGQARPGAGAGRLRGGRGRMKRLRRPARPRSPTRPRRNAKLRLHGRILPRRRPIPTAAGRWRR